MGSIQIKLTTEVVRKMKPDLRRKLGSVGVTKGSWWEYRLSIPHLKPQNLICSKAGSTTKTKKRSDYQTLNPLEDSYAGGREENDTKVLSPEVVACVGFVQPSLTQHLCPFFLKCTAAAREPSHPRTLRWLSLKGAPRAVRVHLSPEAAKLCPHLSKDFCSNTSRPTHLFWPEWSRSLHFCVCCVCVCMCLYMPSCIWA